VALTYEAAYGRLATMTDGIGTTSYTHRPVGQLGAGALASVDGPLVDDTLTYGYDELGRVVNRPMATYGWHLLLMNVRLSSYSTRMKKLPCVVIIPSCGWARCNCCSRLAGRR
jgi:hypothetical protein